MNPGLTYNEPIDYVITRLPRISHYIVDIKCRLIQQNQFVSSRSTKAF